MKPKETFEEIEKFVESCKKHYKISIEISEGPIRQVLQKIESENSNLKAVFMGNRRTDPFCAQMTTFRVSFQFQHNCKI